MKSPKLSVAFRISATIWAICSVLDACIVYMGGGAFYACLCVANAALSYIYLGMSEDARKSEAARD